MACTLTSISSLPRHTEIFARELRHDSDEYGYPAYPHSIVHDGCLYVIFSRDKNKIEVLRVALSEITDK